MPCDGWGDERDIEAGEALIALERDAAIARARQALATTPSDSCVDCDEAIVPARRKAMPLARRCTRCQAIREHAARREDV